MENKNTINLALIILTALSFIGCGAGSIAGSQGLSSNGSSDAGVSVTVTDLEDLDEASDSSNSSSNGGKNALSSSNILSEAWSAGQCAGVGSFKLDQFPAHLEDVSTFTPLGIMFGGHVTPVDHHYIQANDNSKALELLAPANGFIVEIERMPQSVEKEGPKGDFRIILEFSCDFYAIFIHPTEIAEEIYTQAGFLGNGTQNVRIPVQKGQRIATWKQSVDYSLHDAQVNLNGFVIPENYNNEFWKIHTVDTFDYMEDGLRGEILDHHYNRADGHSGNIDYDVEGLAVGNWFLEGSDGYAGTGLSTNYWNDHLAIAYDPFDPDSVIISLGDYNGESKQFAVSGNLPDPAEINSNTGAVAYELIEIQYFVPSSNSYWDRQSHVGEVIVKESVWTPVLGVMLLEVQEDDTLKVEIFPGSTAAGVAGFTSDAQIYTR